MSLNDMSKSLTALGDRMRKTKIDQLTEFLLTSLLCKYRKVTMHRWDVYGRKHHAFRCTNPDLSDKHFGWSCSPNNCPYVGHLPGAFWEHDIEKRPSKAEIKIYEDVKEALRIAKLNKIASDNVLSSTGVIHKLKAGMGCLILACDQNYQLDYSGLWGKWASTGNDITCRNCLKDYEPNGERRNNNGV